VEVSISLFWPLMSNEKSAGRVIFSKISYIALVALPRSIPSRFAVIRAALCWSILRISLGPSCTRMSATADRGIGISSPGLTISRFRSSIPCLSVSLRRTRMSILRSSSRYSVATSPRTLFRTSDATSKTLRP